MSADDKTRILPQVTEAAVGTQLSGIYELDERIASGGMGEVYRGHNIQTDDLVAIKIVLTEFARDPTILSLFKKEASVLNHLAHDAIVRYHVFTVDPGIGRPYLAMEYVHGESLVDLMGKGPMSPEDAAKLCARLASGLSAAHEAGVIHRDLSPDNIILPGGRVDRAKIIDFGIARSAAVGGETLIGGKFAGKYNYVSPEQLGLFGGEVSEQSDIYSLGLVLAAALRAEPLDMSGSQVEIIEKRRTVPDLSTIDPSIRPVLAAMLQPDPARRPHGMAAVAEMANAARTTLTQPPEQRARESTVVGAPETSTPPWSDPQPAAQTAPPSSPPAATGASVATAPPERPADFVEHRRPAFLDSGPPAQVTAAPPPRRTGRIVAIAASLLIVAAGCAYLVGAFEPASEPAQHQAADAAPTESSQPTATAPESPSTPAAEPPAEDTASATPEAVPAPAEATPPETAETTLPQPAEASPPVEPTPQPEIAETSPAPTESEPTAQASPPASQPAETAPATIPTAPAPETTPPVATEAQPDPSTQPQAKPAEPAPAESADNVEQPAAEQQVSRAEPEPPVQPQAEQQPASPEQPAQAEPQAPGPAQTEAVASEEQPATPPAETAAPAPQPVPQPEPSQPEPQVTAKLDNVAERISWLRSYTGGQCFYATTTSATDTATEIEGFGTTVEPFMQLLQSFQTRFNMEPDVGVRLIEPAQCVVADFLRDLPRSSTNPPELTLDRTTIPNGTPVSGRLAELEGRKTELILIDHKGMAFNLNSRLTMNGSRAAFSIPIGLSASDQAAKKVVPQVIIALTSPGGIRAAEFINPVPAKDLLPKVLDEIRATGSDGTATAKYFRLGG